MGTLAARKPPPKQQTRDKPPEVPQATERGYITRVLGSNRGKKALHDLTKMSSATASESSGRIPELKKSAAVSSSTSGTPTGPQTSSLLVSQHPLLCFAALFPLPPAAGGHPAKATKPRGRGGRGLEEPRVESEASSFYVFIRVGTLWHYGFVIINKAFQKM